MIFRENVTLVWIYYKISLMIWCQVIHDIFTISILLVSFKLKLDNFLNDLQFNDNKNSVSLKIQDNCKISFQCSVLS